MAAAAAVATKPAPIFWSKHELHVDAVKAAMRKCAVPPLPPLPGEPGHRAPCAFNRDSKVSTFTAANPLAAACGVLVSNDDSFKNYGATVVRFTYTGKVPFPAVGSDFLNAMRFGNDCFTVVSRMGLSNDWVVGVYRVAAVCDGELRQTMRYDSSHPFESYTNFYPKSSVVLLEPFRA